MPERDNLPVEIVHEISGGKRQGRLEIERFSARERRTRALVALLGAWAIGALTILIPIVHFVAPFVLLAAGVWLAIRRWKEQARMRELTGTCPKCGQSFTQEMEGTPDLPFWTECPHCEASLSVREGQR